ncbi:MAG: VWA domain-containing protein [Verrucomicrobiales bacterium]|nr:VWA domain-containing protein [Verrucomicrobiales bacterium]
MNFQFTHPLWLLLLPLALGWTVWLTWRSEVAVASWRRWLALAVRTLVVLAVCLALAGLQWLKPLEGMNVFFLLDRSDSIPEEQQEAALQAVNDLTRDKEDVDRAGVIVFGDGAGIEMNPNQRLELEKIHAVVGAGRTDIAGAIRLGTAAFPEMGQKRLVLLTDGNENVGDALGAVTAAKALEVSIDVLPMGVIRKGDVALQKVTVPSKLRTGQPFDVNVFVNADAEQDATLRLYQNDRFLGEQQVRLSPGKNLYGIPLKLDEPGFYGYDVQVEVPGDLVPQNNRASSFATVRGETEILIVSSDPAADAPLAAALQSAELKVSLTGIEGFPTTLAEMQSYDAIFLSNIAAGDLGTDLMRLLESAVRDFGVGLVCVGGDQAYAAGGYRGTPLETTLPVDMELSSKKVLPSGAVVLVMHGMEFNNGNQVARECALGVLDALGPQDEMGVVLWDGNDRWLFPLSEVGDKKEKGRAIAGMNQGDLPNFQNVMSMAYAGDTQNPGLKDSKANLRHMIVFSDGDPGPPSDALMNNIVDARITVSTVLISGHAGPDTMIKIADQGRGRFYDVTDPSQLPQIFLKEAMVILKSAIFEEPFQPVMTAPSEVLRGISGAELPVLQGYVCTTPKPRAEVPLVSDKGDPLLAHWQYGLGRAVAFTSDARARWALAWLGWPKYRQFWSQVARWALRRVDLADFNTEVSVEGGEGILSVEALDPDQNYRNFLDLQAVVVNPDGEKQTVRLEQTGPGRYEARFDTRDVGAYLINVAEVQDGQVAASQVVGASVNYSPEFSASTPNTSLLRRIAETGNGKELPPIGQPTPVNPFRHDRSRTFQPRDLWEWLLQFAVIAFVLDVGVRRIDIDREEWLKATATLRRLVFFWNRPKTTAKTDESLASLLSRREQVRSRHTPRAEQPRAELFKPHEETAAPLPGEKPAPPKPSRNEAAPESKVKPPAPEESVTSRLLAAKRKATRKLDQDL